MQNSLLDTAAGQAEENSDLVSAETAETFVSTGFAQKLDDHFVIAGEMIKEKGEDSYYSALSMHSAVAAVFDGCGGLGSRRYPNFGKHTGAYMASRAAVSALRSWFSGNCGMYAEADELAARLSEEMRRSLDLCMLYKGDTSRITGSMVRDFPTTAAIVLVQEPENKTGDSDDCMEVTCFWAGDSRVYLLDGDGLAQLTEDDLRSQDTDAMRNLRTDAPLSNYICAGRDFVLHVKRIQIREPFAVFAASDGCFGYLQTPFHFEEMILSCLLKAETPEAFERLLDVEIREYAGDDYTLAFLNFGFGEFNAFREAFAGRLQEIRTSYIEPIESAGGNVPPTLLADLWGKYQGRYERYLRS